MSNKIEQYLNCLHVPGEPVGVVQGSSGAVIRKHEDLSSIHAKSFLPIAIADATNTKLNKNRVTFFDDIAISNLLFLDKKLFAGTS